MVTVTEMLIISRISSAGRGFCSVLSSFGLLSSFSCGAYLSSYQVE